MQRYFKNIETRVYASVFISKYIQEDKNRNLYGGKSFICMHFMLDIVMVLYSKSCRNLQFKRLFLAM